MSRVSQFLMFVILIGGNAVAQNLEARNSVNTVDDKTVSSAGYAMTPVTPAAVPATPQPQKGKVADKKFILVMSTLGGAEAMSFASRALILENRQAAGDPLVTSHPSNAYLIGKYGAMFAAETFVAYEMKKRHDWLPGDRVVRKLWWVYPVAMATINFKLGIHNVRSKGPGGCTSEAECEALAGYQ